MSEPGKQRSASYRPFAFLAISLTPLLLIFRPTPIKHEFPVSVIPLTRILTSIPSVSGQEQAVTTYAASWLSHHDWRITRQSLPPLRNHSRGRENILAMREAIDNVQVVVSTHLDTVPGDGGLELDVADAAEVVGRGCVDAKGQAAALMIAATALGDPRVAVLLVAGEETDHGGMSNAHALGLPAGITLVNAEPTEGKVASFQKGMVKGIIRARGKAAHSGYPALGESAVHNLLSVLHDLRETWPGVDGTTLNVGTIQGGAAPNVVAEYAEAGVMWRLVEEPDALLGRVEKVLEGRSGVEFEVLTRNAPMSYHVPPRAAEAFGTTSVAYNTDVPYYTGGYARAVLFGGGSIRVAHTERESIPTSELSALPDMFGALIRELLEPSDKL